MLGIITIAVVVPIAAVLAVAARRPTTFRVQRTATIAAPPEAIVPLLHDFRRWSEWSPYEKLDPAMKRTYGGAAAGRGATYAWEGNGKAGAGRMEITDASTSRVVIALDFTRPMRARNTAEFTLEPAGGGATRVTWAMHGPNQLVGRVMSVFIDMDRLIGRDFETGLASLKTLAERQALAAR